MIHINKRKRLYETEFTVIAEYTMSVTTINTKTSEKIIEVFVIRDRCIFPDVLWLLPVELERFEYRENGPTLRETVQALIDCITSDYTPVTY